jgi:predicted ribosomally synthesized peptide with nif11-like leader
MSEEKLSAFLAKLKDDTGLQEKLKGAADLDAVVAIAKDSGFEVSKEDLLSHQANQPLELSDEDLAGVAGGDMRGDMNVAEVTWEFFKETWHNVFGGG